MTIVINNNDTGYKHPLFSKQKYKFFDETENNIIVFTDNILYFVKSDCKTPNRKIWYISTHFPEKGVFHAYTNFIVSYDHSSISCNLKKKLNSAGFYEYAKNKEGMPLMKYMYNI